MSAFADYRASIAADIAIVKTLAETNTAARGANSQSKAATPATATGLYPALERLTFRHRPSDTALPMRRMGSFLPGNSVGGAANHWGGLHWRYLPSDHLCRSHIVERYGAKVIPENMTIQDWATTYDELEPYYDGFDKLSIRSPAVAERTLCLIAVEATPIGGIVGGLGRERRHRSRKHRKQRRDSR
jgi:choline dehydrogenase-like flavoprotein